MTGLVLTANDSNWDRVGGDDAERKVPFIMVDGGSIVPGGTVNFVLYRGPVLT